MNIFELLSFDIVEFVTSIEGILIIVGILFLIIGIVLLCMGKEKKKDDASATTETNSSIVKEENIATAPIVNNTPSVTPEMPKVETPIVNEPQLVQNAPSMVNNAGEAKPIIVPSTSGGLQEGATTPVVEPINFTEEAEKQDIKIETLGIDNKTEELSNTPTALGKINITDSNSLNNESMVKEETTPITVYGGTNPETVIKKEILEEKPREIYGGANPLENTAPIPTNTVREAYSGGIATPSSGTTVETKTEPVISSVVEPKIEQTLNEPVDSAVNLSTPTPSISQPTMPTPTPSISQPTMPTPTSSVSQPTVPTPTSIASQPATSTSGQENIVEDKKEEIEKLEF